jgi:integrase
VPSPARTADDPLSVAGFLDLYYARYVKPRSLRGAASVRSRIGVLKANLGELPVSAIERPEPINRFKTESEYAEEVELATVHRVLEVLRTALNWGRAQTPPLIMQSPFHKFGVTMSKKDEASRDRRLGQQEERQLLHTALHQMNTAEHQYVGPLLHDRITAALELCCRRGEILLIQNRRVDWERHQIAILGATAKDKENRRIPFDPHGRLRLSGI